VSREHRFSLHLPFRLHADSAEGHRAPGYSRSFVIYDADDSRRVCRTSSRRWYGRAHTAAPGGSVGHGSGQGPAEDAEQLKAECGGDYRLEKIAEVYARYQKRLKAPTRWIMTTSSH
jgi:hypothetical protein